MWLASDLHLESIKRRLSGSLSWWEGSALLRACHQIHNMRHSYSSTLDKTRRFKNSRFYSLHNRQPLSSLSQSFADSTIIIVIRQKRPISAVCVDGWFCETSFSANTANFDVKPAFKWWGYGCRTQLQSVTGEWNQFRRSTRALRMSI